MHAQASESGMCPGRARVNIYLLQIIPLEVAIGYKKQIEPIEFDSLDTKSPQLLFPRFQLLFPRFQRRQNNDRCTSGRHINIWAREAKD